MRFGWSLHAGPFWLSDTLWRSKPRRRQQFRPARRVWHGTLADGWQCPHNHLRPDTATECALREARRRVKT